VCVCVFVMCVCVCVMCVCVQVFIPNSGESFYFIQNTNRIPYQL
jgi:hypothetical protein